MKIILLGPAWPYRGGIADFSDRLAKEYKSQGCEVEVVTFTLQYPKFLFPGKTQYNDNPAPADWPTRRMMNSINPLSWLRTGLYLRRQKADIIVSAFWLPFMAPCMGTILRLAKRKGTRRIGLLHNLIPHEHRIGDKLFARYFIKSNDAFISLSKSVLDDISTFDSKKPRGFCPHPLYDHYGQSTTKAEARKMLGLDNDGRYALFFGFIRGYKGLDLLLEAMCAVGSYKAAKRIGLPFSAKYGRAKESFSIGRAMMSTSFVLASSLKRASRSGVNSISPWAARRRAAANT